MNEHGMCSFEDFEKLYREKVDKCNVQKLCRSKDEL